MLGLLFHAALAGQVALPPEIPDFSWAGYASGRRPIPTPPVSVEVTDFGAVAGDGRDDSAGFQAALDSLSSVGGVVFIPEGRWTLERPIDIRDPRLVLRGAGRGRTVIDCPYPLANVYGPSERWSWSGGFIRITPRRGELHRLGRVTAEVEEGATRFPFQLEVGAEGIEPGEWLELRWFNDEGHDSLLETLHGGVVSRSRLGEELRESSSVRVREWIQVVGFGDGVLEIGQPLVLPLRPEWRPELVRRPLVRECGIESLSLLFPRSNYPGHLHEAGFNAIAVSNAVDCWVRGIEIRNADNGVLLNTCKRVEVRDLSLAGRTLHHGFSLAWSSDCLVTEWRIDAPQVHGTTLGWSSHRNVFSQGIGRDLAMDCHRAAPFQNLHTAIVVDCTGKALQPLRSGGREERGPHAGFGNVYWNLEFRFADGGQSLRVTGLDDWPRAVFAGWRGNGSVRVPIRRALGQVLLDPEVAPDPPDLHRYQVQQRDQATSTEAEPSD